MGPSGGGLLESGACMHAHLGGLGIELAVPWPLCWADRRASYCGLCARCRKQVERQHPAQGPGFLQHILDLRTWDRAIPVKSTVISRTGPGSALACCIMP